MMTETIDIEGKVIDYTPAFKPSKGMRNWAISYVTVECPMGYDKEGNAVFAYYCFKMTSAPQIRKLFRNADIKCTLVRKTKLWTVNGSWQLRDQKEFLEGERKVVGRVPIIFEDYEMDKDGEFNVGMPDTPGLLEIDPEEDDGLPF